MSIINKTPNIMENALDGEGNQYDLAVVAADNQDLDLALQHAEAARSLSAFAKNPLVTVYIEECTCNPINGTACPVCVEANKYRYPVIPCLPEEL